MYDHIRKGEKGMAYGYMRIAEMNKPHASMLMDFGVLRLKKDQDFGEEQPLERACMLIYGGVAIQWEGKQRTVRKKNCFDESPWVLHVSVGTKVSITGEAEDNEVTVHRTNNDITSDADPYTPEGTADEFRGAGTIEETCTRIVRTVSDESSAPQSDMILGEVINTLGKWSSYPPHIHPQPEIYHYKFNPTSGYGFSEADDGVTKIHNNDTVFLEASYTHSQVAGPGCALQYMWCIRHSDGDPYIAPYSLSEHAYIKEPGIEAWEPKKK